MLSSMASLNSAFEAPFADFLAAVIADRSQHIRFLNLLSLLEHIGSRKIMLSQMKGILTQDILKHLAEETRHAFFFKRQAEKLAGRPLEGYTVEDTMCSGPGQIYFGRLDAGLTGKFPAGTHAEISYLWVSLIVELRALWVYRLYQTALAQAGYVLKLKSLIAEEDRHLADMFDRLTALGFEVIVKLPEAAEFEVRLFAKLFSNLRMAVAITNPMLANSYR